MIICGENIFNLWILEGISLLRVMGKRSLNQYKNEGYDMFLEMMTNMRRNVIYSMFMFQPKTDKDAK